VHGCLLVTYQDVLDLFLFEHLVVNRQDRSARVAEYELDTLLLKATDGDFSAGELSVRRHSRGGHFHDCGLSVIYR
jgi:hypothetical protein